MGTAGAHANGLDEAPVTLKDSVTGLVSKVRILPSRSFLSALVVRSLTLQSQIDNSTKKDTSGTFVSFDGEHIEW